MILKDSIYWQIFGDVWNFFKKFSDVEETDAYWEAVVNESAVLYEKYKSTKENVFAKGLLLNVINELEQVYKRRREKLDE